MDIRHVEHKVISLSQLVNNEGQIPDVPRNPRQITEDDFAALKKSIQEDDLTGVLQMIVTPYNGQYIVLGGNMRLRALRDLGSTDAECAIVPAGTPAKVLRKIVQSDNSNFGDYDWDALANEWDAEELKEWGVDLPDFAQEEETEQAQEDDFDESKDAIETRCNKGDVWQLGEHRLMCGDSTSENDVAVLMDDAKADMMFTDPPYGYEYKSNYREKTPKFDVLKNDDKILDFLHVAKRFNNGFVFVCTSWKVLSQWLPVFEKEHELTNMLIWSKGGGGLGSLKDTFLTDYEVILVSHNNSEITGKRLGSVWEIGRDDVNSYTHPTQKPIALSATAIENTTRKGESVLDLFGGSGSTMMACEQLGRKCYMMELDPHYCDVIIARWEKLTGKTATKL